MINELRSLINRIINYSINSFINFLGQGQEIQRPVAKTTKGIAAWEDFW